MIEAEITIQINATVKMENLADLDEHTHFNIIFDDPEVEAEDVKIDVTNAVEVAEDGTRTPIGTMRISLN